MVLIINISRISFLNLLTVVFTFNMYAFSMSN